jgi:hypothetical protein
MGIRDPHRVNKPPFTAFLLYGSHYTIKSWVNSEIEAINQAQETLYKELEKEPGDT